MFTKSERFYDAIYAWKDYAREAGRLQALIERHKLSPGSTLLDVACGTGGHIPFLRDAFTIEGLDLDPAMIAIAQARNPGTRFHHGNMIDFDLGRRFDAVVCLFSSIGYTRTADRLQQAIATMARHVLPGGVLAIEPFFEPSAWTQGDRPNANFVDQPDLKIARMIRWRVEDRVAAADFHYLVATSEGIEHFSERHELGLFTDEEFREAFKSSGLTLIHDAEGLMGRGLYLGVRPL